jgi:hypothetical protein
MNGQTWYPAAALSAILLSCAGATDDSQGKPATGGGTGIDGGAPSATGSQPSNYYGVRLTGGTSGVSTSTTAGTGGIDVAHSTTGGMATGGFSGVYLYGPRFDKPDSSAISTGGSRARSKPALNR